MVRGGQFLLLIIGSLESEIHGRLNLMNDDIVRSLSHLLPTVTLPYPPSLVATASSIRDFSRRNICLRPEEEPSRPWFASWLAAERSRTPIPCEHGDLR